MSDLITEALKYIEKPKPKPPTLWDKIKGLYFAWKYTKKITDQIESEKRRLKMQQEKESDQSWKSLEEIIQESKNKFNGDY
jgi:hypothetical protein